MTKIEKQKENIFEFNIEDSDFGMIYWNKKDISGTITGFELKFNPNIKIYELVLTFPVGPVNKVKGFAAFEKLKRVKLVEEMENEN